LFEFSALAIGIVTRRAETRSGSVSEASRARPEGIALMFFLLQFQLLIWALILSAFDVADFVIVFQVLTWLPGFSAPDREAGGRRPGC
jgi:hypothetical protein